MFGSNGNSGMEMMLSRIIGIDPKQLKEMAEKVVTNIEAVATTLSEMKNELEGIKVELEDLKNARTENAPANDDGDLHNRSGGGGSNGKRRKSANGNGAAVEL